MGPCRIHGLKLLPIRGGADEIHGVVHDLPTTRHTPHAHDLPWPKKLPTLNQTIKQLKLITMLTTLHFQLIPIITPKFDPATGDIINERLQIPGETLYSEKGSPVVTSNPSKLSARELASLTTVGDKELVVAFLNNPETVNTFKAFEKTYNKHKSRKE
ncbi:hypothetical protein DAPPUDRAFT_118744 [Daphnia pulex]|uniref:Uncharacterized protein n=1 Tax=Daphnia pulex TaxID=6669 RepID=E9HWK0_DAPPU|nr:hypothetical protein DAPPUDRAFT_118744 [Daphnia pulex]|eukprot:EFX63878.1 hypothetical protein DAPPUDRAFT_118744 [Daphnia pulex]